MFISVYIWSTYVLLAFKSQTQRKTAQYEKAGGILGGLKTSSSSVLMPSNTLSLHFITLIILCISLSLNQVYCMSHNSGINHLLALTDFTLLICGICDVTHSNIIPFLCIYVKESLSLKLVIHRLNRTMSYCFCCRLLLMHHSLNSFSNGMLKLLRVCLESWRKNLQSGYRLKRSFKQLKKASMYYSVMLIVSRLLIVTVNGILVINRRGLWTCP